MSPRRQSSGPKKGEAARLVLSFGQPLDIHRIRNLGEDIWRALRNDRRASIELEQVDRATDALVLLVPTPSKKKLKWVEDLLAGLLKQHKLDNHATVTLVQSRE